METLKKLKQGQQVEIPVYDFSTHSRTTEPVTMYGASVIIFEGILAFSTPALRELMDVKLFVSEVCFAMIGEVYVSVESNSVNPSPPPHLPPPSQIN